MTAQKRKPKGKSSNLKALVYLNKKTPKITNTYICLYFLNNTNWSVFLWWSCNAQTRSHFALFVVTALLCVYLRSLCRHSQNHTSATLRIYIIHQWMNLLLMFNFWHFILSLIYRLKMKTSLLGTDMLFNYYYLKKKILTDTRPFVKGLQK